MKQLFPHQKEALNWLKDKPKAMLCLDAGLGKTAIAVKTIKPNENVLIICPATLKINWARELSLWLEHDAKITIIKKKVDELQPGINIVNYDILGKKVKGKKTKVEPNFDFKNFKADRVILDESHYIKNSKSIRSKISAKLVKLTPNAILLTGTAAERSMDLYVPLFSLGATDMKMHDFGIVFCDGKKIYLGRREVWDYRGNTNTDILKEMMEPFTLIMKKEDVIDLPDKVFKVIELDLPISKREKEYNLDDIIDDPRPLGFEGLASLLKDQAILKLPLAISHIKMRLESTQKLVIFAKHHEVIDGLMDSLESFNPVKLDGRDSAKEKDLAVKTFQEDKDCRVFVGQIKAANVGITLTAANNVVFVETNWSYSDLSQAGDRTHRIKQKKDVYIEILSISNSIDSKVLYKTLQKKETIEVLGL